MKSLGSVLKMVRTGRELTQKQVADSVGVTDAYISALELGKRDPSWSMVQRLCETLEVSTGLVILLTQDHDPDCIPFVHAAYAMLWRQIKESF